MTKRPFKFEVGVGFAHCNTFPQGGRVPARNTEIIRKHFHDHQENLPTAVLSIFPLREKLCFDEG